MHDLTKLDGGDDRPNVFFKRQGIYRSVFQISWWINLQARGHQRSPSDTQAFRERTKRDALNELQHELEKLEESATGEVKEEFHRQFDGFTHLFKRFLQEEGPSLEWDRIQKLPDDAVNNNF